MWGATVADILDELYNGISIHAPMWGATVTVTHGNALDKISIHAPMWGATEMWEERDGSQIYFNPRTHVGCDVFTRLERRKA